MKNYTLLLVVAFLLISCSTTPERQLSTQPTQFASLPNGHDPYNPAELLPIRDSTFPASSLGVITYFEGARGHALNIMQLSGGGQNGAFGAGFLKGWREAGTRPEFDIVTGVSTGALLATHTFLGTKSDDEVLEKIFTQTTADDIYNAPSPILDALNLLFGETAFFDTTPLKKQLDEVITMDVMKRVAEAHDNNRRLWIGTTNLDYNQTWVWNMGSIAKQGDQAALELYKKVLRASAAPPIAFPPVEIEGHLFADGSVRQNIVVIGLTGKDQPVAPKFGPGNIYTIHNGKDLQKPHALENSALKIAGPVLNTMMTNSMDSLLLRSYFAAKYRGYNYHLTAIPDDADIGNNALAFDQQQMRNGFNAGYALAQTPDAWMDVPPVLSEVPEWFLRAPTESN